MGLPAAKQGDQIAATDFHVIILPLLAIPILVSLPFTGIIDQRLSPEVHIMGRRAAVQGSTATNSPIHIPPVGTFQTPPHNQGEILTGSPSVFINGKPAARSTDSAKTCNDPFDVPRGQVIASGTVFIG
jgi:uncharacterized Zn-binding protein involved in type VI secretion